MSERFRQAVAVLKQGGEMDMRIDEIGTQRDCAPIMLLGVRLAAGQFDTEARLKCASGEPGVFFSTSSNCVSASSKRPTDRNPRPRLLRAS